MEHPLIPNLNNLTIEELTVKIADLNKKLYIAYNSGNAHLCDQIRMALESYQNVYLNKTNDKGDNFNDVIDIS